MSRKKKKRNSGFRNRKLLRSPARPSTNNQLKVSCMDDWEQPDWLKKITSLVDQGEIEKAAESLTEELVENHIKAASMPEKAFIIVAAARLLRQISQTKRAENLYKQLLELRPENIAVFNEIAGTLQEQGKINDAVKYLTTAMKISPDDPKIWANLGTNLVRLGQTEKGIDLIRNAVEKIPDNNLAWSNLLLFMHYLQDIDRTAIFEKTRQWAQTKAPPHLAKTQHDNDPDPHRKLRIGYISPDFRRHSVTFFFEPLLDGHNREVVEVYGYGNVAIVDDTTKRLKKKFDHYRNTYRLEHKAVAELIESDQIDILVDLAGHSGGSGVYAMAYKPAPIQVTWLGYPDTTGMSQMDYRLADSITDPPGSEKFYTEKLFYLPDGFLCYGPGDMMPPLRPLPAERTGRITFGSFNNSTKTNPFITELWSRVLKATERSNLLLKFKSGQDAEVREMFLQRFENFGISRDRIATSGWLPPPAHLELYNHVDIALDTYPYNGTTTTCQALLMGVPVISLAGNHHMSRVGLSILTRLGMEFFSASTPDEYVSKASALAAKPDALAKMRASMRARMAASPLCNRGKFAKNIEQAYRKMWHRWCKSRGVEIVDSKAEPHDEHQEVEHPDEHQNAEADIKSSEPTQPDIVSPVPRNKIKAKRGIMYLIWGDSEKIENSLQAAIKSAKEYHPELPIHVERLKTGSKITKTKIYDMTPFEETAFLDNDTVVMGRLDFGFEKAAQFGLACTLNGCPLARRYRDKRLSGDMIEYSSGVLFFTKKAKPVFDAFEKLFPTVDSSIIHYKDGEKCLMPEADQASFALAIEQTGFQPFVLPHNWNLHPQWNRIIFGPVKVWHGYHKIPEVLLSWNKQQSDENAIVRFFRIDMTEVPPKKHQMSAEYDSGSAAVAKATSVTENNDSDTHEMVLQADSQVLSDIAQMAVTVDEMHRTGRRSLAAEHAVEGLNRISLGEKAHDVPQDILSKWNAQDEKTLFLRMCISLANYSSCQDPSIYIKMFNMWKASEPFNAEPYLRLGILLALEAQPNQADILVESLELLRHADKTMRNERSAAALALAQRKLTELVLPYDRGRIHVYPDLANLTTYVLLEKGDWFEDDDLDLFRALIQPDDKVLDLGANVGVYAISAALRLGEKGLVVAVEPTQTTFELLSRSACGFPNMTAIQAAISDKAGTGLLVHDQMCEINRLVTEQGPGEKVQVFSIDDIAKRVAVEQFDIIKMDIEGHEHQALKGAKKIIGENSPIIFYEIKQAGDFHFKLIDAFAEMGYDSYYYVRGTSTLVKFCEGMELDNYLLNMIAARPESLCRFDGLVNIAQSSLVST